MNIVELFKEGGPAMWPLLVLSILSVSVILERLWFWGTILTKEKDIINRILDAASQNWAAATEIAKRSTTRPIGRFLYAPLRLYQPEPEVFRLALETSADEELNSMRRGDKVLEAVIALAPLLGLLGTVLGLIRSLRDIRLGDIGTSATAGVTLGISQALISTATGLIVAITSLVFYRLFQGLQFNQAKLFRTAGSELELLYRQFWSKNGHNGADEGIKTSEPPLTNDLDQPPASKVDQGIKTSEPPLTNDLDQPPASKVNDFEPDKYSEQEVEP